MFTSYGGDNYFYLQESSTSAYDCIGIKNFADKFVFLVKDSQSGGDTFYLAYIVNPIENN